jgi:hypothetical protein
MPPLVQCGAPLFLLLTLLVLLTRASSARVTDDVDSRAVENALVQHALRQTSSDKHVSLRAGRAAQRRLYKKDPPLGGDPYDCGSVSDLFNEVYPTTENVGDLPALPCFLVAGTGMASDDVYVGDPLPPPNTVSPAPTIEVLPATFAPSGAGRGTHAPSTTPTPTALISDVPTVARFDMTPWPTQQLGTLAPTALIFDYTDNNVDVSFYLALLPRRPSQPFVVSTVLTDFLNETMADRWRVFIEKNTTDRTRSRRRLAAASSGETPLDLVLWSADSSISRRDDTAWWWKHSVSYRCFNGTTDEPVYDMAILRRAAALVIAAVNSTQFFERLEQSPLHPDLVGFAYDVVPPPISPNNDNILEGENVLQPVDPRLWNARRWFGLGAFCFVVVGFALLSHVAALRQKKRQRKQVWGQVGTVEGVDELLRTGWHLQGNRMEIYDRTGIGYRDDDSLFQGGYEQKEAIIGAAFSMTQRGSETERTPDTDLRS